MSKQEDLKLSEMTQQLEKALEGKVTVDKNGVPTIEPGIYENNLIETTKEQIKANQTFDTSFVAALSNVYGKACITAMEKNKSLERIPTVSVKTLGGNSVELRFERSKTYGKGDDAVTKKGVLSVGVTTRAAKNKSGELGRIRKNLNLLADGL